MASSQQNVNSGADLTLAGSSSALGGAGQNLGLQQATVGGQNQLGSSNSLNSLVQTPQDEILMLILSGKYRFKVGTHHWLRGKMRRKNWKSRAQNLNFLRSNRPNILIQRKRAIKKLAKVKKMHQKCLFSQNLRVVCYWVGKENMILIVSYLPVLIAITPSWR